MSERRQETDEREKLLGLKAVFDEEPESAEARAARDKTAIEFLKSLSFVVIGGMVVDKSGIIPQMVPVIKKARRIVNIALCYPRRKN